jgi:hypothetical protein
MFIGHYAAGFACKAVAPRASLGTYFAAVQFLDLLWPPLVLAGIERVRVDPGNTAFTPLDFVHYPYSHSLLMAAVWSVGFAAVHYWRRRDAATAAWLGGAVFSHWVLDWISHRADLPLAPGVDVYVGVGLWNSVAATLAVEGGLFAVALALYVSRTRASSRAGTWGLAALAGVLAAIYLGNLAAVPPPGATAVALAGLGLWLFVAWGWWVGRHRVAAAAPSR